MTKPLVLIVEDEAPLVTLLRYNLEKEGFEVGEASDGEEALTRIAERKPDIVLLDWMLPLVSGIEVCRQIRRSPQTRTLPVIMLTARGEEADRIVGLELGADDYVTKPFSPRELAARVRSVLRRSGGRTERPERLEYADVVLDGASREVTKAGEAVNLTAREFDLLWFLAANPRRVFSRSHLMDRVWGHAPALDTGTVTVHIRRLREKLEADPSRPAHLQTVWGVGYRFDP
ncbi:MAG TPA: response regulator [Stellaceae bacterium]|nr:response regulator [Stellaceae bacterium]